MSLRTSPFPLDKESRQWYSFIQMTPPKPAQLYYYGGLPIGGARRKGRLWIEAEVFCFQVLEGKGTERIDLKVPFSRMEKIYLTRDNYYGSDTVLFNLTFRDETERSFTLRFAPVALIPRRRIALQKHWFDYLTSVVEQRRSSTDRG